MEDEDYIWKLIARSIYGELHADEKKELESYLSEKEGLRHQLELMHSVLAGNAPLSEYQKDNLSVSAASLIGKIREIEGINSRSRKNRRVSVTAAMLLIAVVGVAFILVYTKDERGDVVSGKKTAFEAAPGTRKYTTLADGTRVWLNAGSTLQYITRFSGATREVKLTGEAFFEVAENKEKPFIVHAGDIDIKVLGTAFNVTAYETGKTITTSLYRGLISVTQKGNSNAAQPILVYPNQKLIVPSGSSFAEKPVAAHTGMPESAIRIEQLDSSKTEEERIETAWRYDRLEFRGDDFVSLALKMELWYNVKIHFLDDRVKRQRFNGSFEEETLPQALNALKIANPFNYKIENDEVFIRSAP